MINVSGDSGPLSSPGGSPSPRSIILISTNTIDRIPTPNGILEVAGGPPRFIVPALEISGWDCRVVTGALATVNVVVGGGGEEYVVPPLPRIRLPAFLQASAIIFSPIMREIDIHHLPDLDGMVVADLQGFVRHPGVPSGKPDHNVDLAPLLQHVDVIKATARELEALSTASRTMLRDKVLLLTQGREGALVIQGDRVARVASQPVHGVATIGAGDTFLAYFTAGLLDGTTPQESALRAARFTEAFLEARRP
jgi:hypothetical protein